MGDFNAFEKWPSGIHDTAEQKKRLESAKSSKTTPDSIDKEHQSGMFAGSGAAPYATTLDSCTCGDFFRRQLPCKHMYRLAIELGLLDEAAEKGINKNTLERQQFTLEEAVAELENLTEAAQRKLGEIIQWSNADNGAEFPVLWDEAYESLSGCPLLVEVSNPKTAIKLFKRNQIISILDEHKISGFKRNMSVDNLRTWCVETIEKPLSVFPKVMVFVISERFQKVRRSVLMYLRRKFEWEFSYNGEMQRIRYPYGSLAGDLTITVSSDGTTECTDDSSIFFFPDDRITELLTLYGHNRCLHGYHEQVDPHT